MQCREPDYWLEDKLSALYVCAVAPISLPNDRVTQQLSSIRNFRDLASACTSITPGELPS